MEWRGGYFEAQADQHHGERKKGHSRRSSRAKRGGDGGNAGGAGCAIGKRNAVQEERCGERSEKEILDRRLDCRAFTFAKTGQNIGRDRRYLQSDEDHQQLHRTGHQHHADRAKENQGEVFAGVDFEVIQRTKQCGNHHSADQQMKEDAESVHLNTSAEGGEHTKAKLIDTEQARGRGSRNGQPAERLAACAGF